MPLRVIQHYSYGFIAQLVEHCTGIAEVTGSNPAEAWIFFRLLFRNCLNCVSTAKIFHNVIIVIIITIITINIVHINSIITMYDMQENGSLMIPIQGKGLMS